MSRARTWTGRVNWPLWGHTYYGEDGPEQILYVTLDNQPDRQVEIRVPLGRLVIMGKRARTKLEEAAGNQGGGRTHRGDVLDTYRPGP